MQMSFSDGQAEILCVLNFVILSWKLRARGWCMLYGIQCWAIAGHQIVSIYTRKQNISEYVCI